MTYGLFNAQERGQLFIGPGVPVYEGMVVGVCPKAEDISVNVCKKKQLTNMRAAGSDEALRLVPPRILSLEQCLEFLADDELLEVTPKNLRIRKRILDRSLHHYAAHRQKYTYYGTHHYPWHPDVPYYFVHGAFGREIKIAYKYPRLDGTYLKMRGVVYDYAVHISERDLYRAYGNSKQY